MERLHNDVTRRDCCYCGKPSAYPLSVVLLPVCAACEEASDAPTPGEVRKALTELAELQEEEETK